GDAHRVAEAGFDGYLVRPIRPSFIFAALCAIWADAQDRTKKRTLVTRHSLAERITPSILQGNPQDFDLSELRRSVAPQYVPQPQTQIVSALPPRNVAPRLLLVEDNAVNQLVASRMLERLGLTVEFATDGKKAVDMVAANRYDLVFMDCQMPVMDGYQATEQIRRAENAEGAGRDFSNGDDRDRRRHVIIVAMTANAMESDRQRCLDAGMDDYI